MTDHIISREWMSELMSMHVSDARKREIRDMVLTRPANQPCSTPELCSLLNEAKQRPAPSPHLNEQYFTPMLKCDCEVCKDAREQHDITIRNATLDESCNIDLTRYVWGDLVSEDVRKCEGISCNYCGRYNQSLRAKEQP